MKEVLNSLKKNLSGGITLIALVITIVVLLILAGVSIKMLGEDDGIIDKAIEAKTKMEKAAKDEDNILSSYEDLLNNSKTLKGEQQELIDEEWKISKDTNTKISKVNVYLESIYYKPSFKEFFAREFAPYALSKYHGITFYDETDGVDFWFFLITMMGMEDDEIDEIKEEILQNYSEYEKEIIYEYGFGVYDISDTLTEQEQKSQIEELFKQLQEKNDLDIDLTEKYQEILHKYDEKYENVMEMPESIRNKSYKILLPNGKSKTFTGEELITNRIRYPVNQNGKYSFAITTGNYEKGLNVQVSNIENYIVEKGDYIYTYNCVPAFPACSYNKWQEVMKEYNIDVKITDFRLGLNGWNAYVKDDSKTEYEPILEKINGEDVTGMVGTYAGCYNLTGFSTEKFQQYCQENSTDVIDMYKNINITIPKSITNMLYTFYGDEKLVIAPIISKNVEAIYEPFYDCKTLKIITYGHLKGKRPYYWVSSSGTKKIIDVIFLPQNSTMTFDEDELNNKIKRWNYDDNGYFYTTETIDKIFCEEVN